MKPVALQRIILRRIYCNKIAPYPEEDAAGDGHKNMHINIMLISDQVLSSFWRSVAKRKLSVGNSGCGSAMWKNTN